VGERLNLFLVGIGAALGAVIRYGLTLVLPAKEFPWATVFINLSGSFLLGCVAAYWAKDHPTRLLLGVGLLGGYTTYSTYALETFQQLQKGEFVPALLNISLQSCGSVLACGLGYIIVSRFK
jgi:fluoride exporter